MEKAELLRKCITVRGGQRRMKKRTKRIYGILLSMSMLLTLVSMPVWATETVETGAGYEQEQKQTQEQEQKQT